jgi:plasmid stabilization system protein ParE
LIYFVKNPQAAQRISDGVLKTAEALAEYPESHPMVRDKLPSRLGIRIA